MSEGEGEGRGRLAEVLRARRESLKRLRDKGIEPFALRFDKDADAAGLHAKFDDLQAGEESGQRAARARPGVPPPKQGKLSFLTPLRATRDPQPFLPRD